MARDAPPASQPAAGETRMMPPRAGSRTTTGHRARCVSPHPGQFAPDTPPRCSRASPSSVRRSRDAPDCDGRNSAWSGNAGPTALRAPRRGRTPFARANSPRRSRRATFARETGPVPATDPARPALRPAHDNDSAARTTRRSGWRGRRTRPAGRARNRPCDQGGGRCRADARSRRR